MALIRLIKRKYLRFSGAQAGFIVRFYKRNINYRIELIINGVCDISRLLDCSTVHSRHSRFITEGIF